MLVILDRDGVINEDSEYYIKSPAEWIPIPGSLEAIARLKRANWQVVVATNQSGVGRGLYTEDMLEKIHQKMKDELQKYDVELDGIFYCPHTPSKRCDCRKPEPGLFQQIAKHFKVDLRSVYCIGDSLRDIRAAQKVFAKPILVLTGNGQKTVQEIDPITIPIFNNLAKAVDSLVVVAS